LPDLRRVEVLPAGGAIVAPVVVEKAREERPASLRLQLLEHRGLALQDSFAVFSIPAPAPRGRLAEVRFGHADEGS
jgi:hypothetical protein